MIYIDDYWESISTLDKCLNLVREYHELFKECEMEKSDCNDNFDELYEKENTIRMLEEKLRRLKNGNS